MRLQQQPRLARTREGLRRHTSDASESLARAQAVDSDAGRVCWTVTEHPAVADSSDNCICPAAFIGVTITSVVSHGPRVLAAGPVCDGGAEEGAIGKARMYSEHVGGLKPGSDRRAAQACRLPVRFSRAAASESESP